MKTNTDTFMNLHTDIHSTNFEDTKSKLKSIKVIVHPYFFDTLTKADIEDEINGRIPQKIDNNYKLIEFKNTHQKYLKSQKKFHRQLKLTAYGNQRRDLNKLLPSRQNSLTSRELKIMKKMSEMSFKFKRRRTMQEILEKKEMEKKYHYVTPEKMIKVYKFYLDNIRGENLQQLKFLMNNLVHATEDNLPDDCLRKPQSSSKEAKKKVNSNMSEYKSYRKKESLNAVGRSHSSNPKQLRRSNGKSSIQARLFSTYTGTMTEPSTNIFCTEAIMPHHCSERNTPKNFFKFPHKNAMFNSTCSNLLTFENTKTSKDKDTASISLQDFEPHHKKTEASVFDIEEQKTEKLNELKKEIDQISDVKKVINNDHNYNNSQFIRSNFAKQPFLNRYVPKVYKDIPGKLLVTNSEMEKRIFSGIKNKKQLDLVLKCKERINRSEQLINTNTFNIKKDRKEFQNLKKKLTNSKMGWHKESDMQTKFETVDYQKSLGLFIYAGSQGYHLANHEKIIHIEHAIKKALKQS